MDQIFSDPTAPGSRSTACPQVADIESNKSTEVTRITRLTNKTAMKTRADRGNVQKELPINHNVNSILVQ